jgi:hypothetical protein
MASRVVLGSIELVNVPIKIVLLMYKNAVQIQFRPQAVKQKDFGVNNCSQLLGITIIPKQVTNFLRSTICESVLTREKGGSARPDMLQLLVQASKGALADDTSSEDAEKADKTNGMFDWTELLAICR